MNAYAVATIIYFSIFLPPPLLIGIYPAAVVLATRQAHLVEATHVAKAHCAWELSTDRTQTPKTMISGIKPAVRAYGI